MEWKKRITKILKKKNNDQIKQVNKQVEKSKQTKDEEESLITKGKAGDREEKEQSFLQTRLGWNKIFDHPIPKHANDVTYTLGGTIIVLGIVQLITGVILQQFYIPDSSTIPGAYESVAQIAKSFDLMFVRNLHYWGAQFLLIIALLHMARVFISGAYKRPREIQWLAGVGLLVMLFAFSYTGTVLKWDQEATEALEHQTGTAKMMGPLGSFLTQGFAPNVSLLARLYAFHVTVIPALAIPILGLHLILVRLNGISVPKVVDRYKHLIPAVQEKVPFSTHIIRMFVYGSAVTVLAIIISLLWSAPLYFKGIEGIEITKPPWFLLWLYPLENIFGVAAIAYTTGLVIILLAAVPLVDRREITDPRKRKKMMKAMFALLFIFVGLMVAGSILPSMQHATG
jgi:quinol-cytochrome oxidoreductase complex cytochrome b subunit